MNIRGLAGQLGLSIGTVSRALNGRPDVNAETRARVSAAAVAFGYAPNHSGQSLRRGQTSNVAFVLAASREAPEHGDPFFMGLFEGIQSRLALHALDLVVLLSRAGEDEHAFLRRAVGRGTADGWLISGTHRHDPRIEELARLGIPFATLGRSLSGGSQPWLDLDFEGIADRAVDRLAGFGHKRIALVINNPDANYAHVLTEAFRASMDRHGLRADRALLINEAGSAAGGYRAMDRLLACRRPPTAVVLNGENMAVGFYRRLREGGLEPGRDVSVIGTRDTPSSRYLNPTLTCFDLSLHDLGDALASALLTVMPRIGGATAPRCSLWPLRLVEGGSDGAVSPSPRRR